MGPFKIQRALLIVAAERTRKSHSRPPTYTPLQLQLGEGNTHGYSVKRRCVRRVRSSETELLGAPSSTLLTLNHPTVTQEAKISHQTQAKQTRYLPAYSKPFMSSHILSKLRPAHVLCSIYNKHSMSIHGMDSCFSCRSRLFYSFSNPASPIRLVGHLDDR